ncbi:MAG: bifunctional UDP-4-keto-pentose/UDP-xylose synthase [Alphaproteobacteria bacterium]|nr:bifunctional UDP-4-keto-pentose/UDP-xylose synthase [Alphaproteobacteria bacterium]OJV45426.1 MAG: hypothetical protein BGO28_04845 [Alphaproteobacteria bacterium 43-37]
MKVLILGVNGFIGSSLCEHILKDKEWEIYGMDMECHKISDLLSHPRFHFVEGDITINKEWVAYHIKKCDVVLPLVAIANPALYVKDPLRVFELDFEANLPIVRQCVTYKKRVIFPSTSEVYGMCPEDAFDEENSNLVLGPIHKQRWIYSCSKQMMDRVIYAYGIMEGLDFTLFRPFNWIGPKLDSINDPKEGSSRALTYFLSSILYNKQINLVDGGQQRRSFTDIDDGVDALVRMIENKNQCASGKIFNIGNPKNDFSIAQMADILLETMKTFSDYKDLAESVVVKDVPSKEFFGQHYQDTQHRVPSIENAKKYLGWEPKISLQESMLKTLAFHLNPAQRAGITPQALNA